MERDRKSIRTATHTLSVDSSGNVSLTRWEWEVGERREVDPTPEILLELLGALMNKVIQD